MRSDSGLFNTISIMNGYSARSLIRLVGSGSIPIFMATAIALIDWCSVRYQDSNSLWIQPGVRSKWSGKIEFPFYLCVKTWTDTAVFDSVFTSWKRLALSRLWNKYGFCEITKKLNSVILLAFSYMIWFS